MATKKNAVQNNGVAWAQELGQKYASGIAHQFVLHFNVADYTHSLATVEEYLQAMLSSRDMVISYDIAGGIQFKSPAGAEHRQLFVKSLGLDQQPSGMGDLAASMGLQSADVQQTEAAVELPREPSKALPLLEQALHLREATKDGEAIRPRVAVIITWAEQLAPASGIGTASTADRLATVTLAKWATDPELIVNQGIVVLITRNLSDLAEPLRASTSRIEAIPVTLPDEGTRLAWIEQYIASKQAEYAAEVERIAWEVVRQAMSHGESDTGWYWDGAGSFPWTEDDLDSAPNPELRRQAKKLLTKARRDARKVAHALLLEMDTEVLARTTAGLGLIHIEDIFLRAMHEGRPVDRQLVTDRKAEIIRSEFGDVLEIMEPRFGLDMIAGHTEIKAYMEEYVIGALQKGDTARAPQNVLLMGPAGTGKSALVEAVAHDAGFNCVVLNLAKIFAGLVGASERNLEKALLAIEALTPCIVFMDEIDQKMQRSQGQSGDSGVSSRLFGRILEFMSDTGHRGRIVWMMATNRPDLMDSALKRPGRIDAKIPLLLPTSDEERLELFEVMLRKYKLTCSSEGQHKVVDAATDTDGYTGAEIESIVIKANQIAGRNGRPAGVVHPDDIQTAVRVIAPSTRDIEYMTALALAEVTDLELVPEAYRQAASNKEMLEQKVDILSPKRTAREL